METNEPIKPDEGQPGQQNSALAALRNLRDALRDRHYGRMPDEVQKAYHEASAVLSAHSCVCGDPKALSTIHRGDGPCYVEYDEKD